MLLDASSVISDESDVLVDSPVSTRRTSMNVTQVHSVSPSNPEYIPAHHTYRDQHQNPGQNQTFRFRSHPYSLTESDLSRGNDVDPNSDEQEATAYWPNSNSEMVRILERSAEQNRSKARSLTLNSEPNVVRDDRRDSRSSNVFSHLNIDD